MVSGECVGAMPMGLYHPEFRLLLTRPTFNLNLLSYQGLGVRTVLTKDRLVISDILL